MVRRSIWYHAGRAAGAYASKRAYKGYQKAHAWLHRSGKVWGNRRGKMRIAGYYGRYNIPVMRRGELKFHDLDILDAVIVNTGVIIVPSCNLIAQGTTEIQRIGRKCTIKEIDWRYVLRKNSSTGLVGDDIVRIILYLDKQANGAAPAVLDILETADFQSHYNLVNQSRFRFLIDSTTAVNGAAAAGDGATQDLFSRSYSKRYRKKCNIPIEFSSTVGSITEIRSNNIGLLLISRDGTSGLESSMRLRFSG